MKKTYLHNPNINNGNNISVKDSNNQIKTTDVNILLNRVRLDKKKTFKKKILVSLIFVFLLSSVIAYMII